MSDNQKEPVKLPAVAKLDQIRELAGKPDTKAPPRWGSIAYSHEELARCRLAPRKLVENHTYADLAQVVAPGATGKSTTLIYEAIRMALGLDVWGCATTEPINTLYITGEDQREIIGARLRELMHAAHLTVAQTNEVLDRFRVWDTTGLDVRLARADGRDTAMTDLADRVSECYATDGLGVVVFDPLASFGGSEGAVNDNEQTIVTACRRIIRNLECCVRLVHHTGKGNARDGTEDQYSGRGGSAMADGCRMVTVYALWVPGPKSRRLPEGMTWDSDSTIYRVIRAKLSYASPNLPAIWVQRRGWEFTYALDGDPETAAEAVRANAERIIKFLDRELAAGNRYSRRMLDDSLDVLGLTRAELRSATASLEASNRLHEAPLPPEDRVGRRTTFLKSGSAERGDAF